MKKWILMFFLGAAYFLQAQTFRSGSMLVQLKQGEHTVHFDQAITACILETQDDPIRAELHFYANDAWRQPILSHDPSEIWRSEPIVFQGVTDQVLFRSTQSILIKIHFVFAPPLNVLSCKNKLIPPFCQKPNVISPAIWRSGLPDPKPGRVETEVNHCIVHHSAGNNFNTDYVNVIRNIYLLHTQSNGWDDIGYNYLIAQNGDLFIGRDPQGVADEDNIAGAHFCGKNTGTMGICLLGSYNDTIPSDTTFGTLKHLLTWKLIKEDLMPNESFIHPLGGSELLKVISGHRDGCNTECPGEMVYQKLSSIRSEVTSRIDSCAAFTGIESLKSDCISIQKTTGNLAISCLTPSTSTLTIYGVHGGLIQQYTFIKEISITNLSTGLFYCVVQSENCVQMEKVAILEFTR
jgi:hypothetical protein